MLLREEARRKPRLLCHLGDDVVEEAERRLLQQRVGELRPLDQGAEELLRAGHPVRRSFVAHSRGIAQALTRSERGVRGRCADRVVATRFDKF